MTTRLMTTSILALAVTGTAAIGGTKIEPVMEPEVVEPPAAPAYDWTGFYAGGHIGAGQADVDTRFNPEFDYSTDTGLLGGVQAGYNVQQGNFVFGIEAELGYMDLSGSDESEGGSEIRPSAGEVGSEIALPPGTSSASIETGAYGSLTGRAGYAIDNVLLYGKGGIAAARVEVAATLRTGSGSGSGSAKETMTGWTVGGGVEYGVSQDFTVKAEYMYMDLGDISHDLEVGGTPVGSATHDVTAHTFKIGANYRF